MTYEDNIASRIAWEMEQRGWSQERMAKEMTDAGVPIHQTSIGKIVNPAGKRRSISTNEAVGFAAVFRISLGELLSDPLPVPCPHCNGTGRVRQEVPE